MGVLFFVVFSSDFPHKILTSPTPTETTETVVTTEKSKEAADAHVDQSEDIRKHLLAYFGVDTFVDILFDNKDEKLAYIGEIFPVGNIEEGSYQVRFTAGYDTTTEDGAIATAHELMDILSPLMPDLQSITVEYDNYAKDPFYLETVNRNGDWIEH